MYYSTFYSHTSYMTSSYTLLVKIIVFMLSLTTLTACSTQDDPILSSSSQQPPAEECTESGYPNPASMCENEGLEIATEEQCATTECQAITFNDACGQVAEALCYQPEECMDVGYPNPASICESEGLEIATEEDCASTECQTITFEIACDQTATVLCRQAEANCLAYPSCSDSFVESDAPCRRGEEECEEVSLCGVTISCRPDFVCDAVPTCTLNTEEYASSFACEEEEDRCYGVTTCGETIFCRPITLCEAAPTCAEDEITSQDPCLARESDTECYTNTICAYTVSCRGM